MEEALHQLMFQVEMALDLQETALGVFLDKEGAFNNTSYDSMCAGLIKHGIDYTIVWWIRVTLESHMAWANLSESSKIVAVFRGFPH